MGMGVVMRITLALGIFCLCSHSAMAAEGKEDFARKGVYLGLGTVYAVEDAGSGIAPGFGSDIEDSLGFDARFGARFNPYVGGELRFQYYNEFTGSEGGVDISHFNGQAFSVNVKVTPLKGRFQPYLGGGLGFLRFEPDKVASDFMWQLTGGLDTYITRNVVIYTEASWILPADELEEFRLVPVTLGLQYRFD